MQKVLIIGGGGMIGQKLAWQLAANGLSGTSVDVTLADVAFPPSGAPGRRVTCDLTVEGKAGELVAARPDIVFQLASVVSGEAEQDFHKGWHINVGGQWALLKALEAEHRHAGGAYVPRVVFSSSIAVFGAPFPARCCADFGAESGLESSSFQPKSFL